MFTSIIRRWREWRWRKLSDRFNAVPGGVIVGYCPERSQTVYKKPTAMLIYDLATGKGRLQVIGE